MRRHLPSIVALLAACFLHHPAAAQAPAADKFDVKQNRQAVVLIKTFTPGFPPSIGTGFLVSKDGLIYTNRHVVEPPDENLKGTIIVVGVPTVKNPDEFAYYKAELVPTGDTAKPKSQDFAVLKIAAKKGEPDFKPLTLSYEKADLGSDVAVLGYPVVKDDSPGLSFNKGGISGTRVQFENGSYYQTDAAVNPGNSGGPMLNAKGEVIGIVTLKKRGASNIGFALQLDEVKPAIEHARNKAASVQALPGPTDPKALPLPKKIRASKDFWDIAHADAKEEKGVMSIDSNGGEYWITSKEALPDNFQLSILCVPEFLQGRQVIRTTQRSILRTFGVGFGIDDPTKNFLSQGGTRIQWSAEQMLIKRDGQTVENKRSGNAEALTFLTVTKYGKYLSVSANGEMLVKIKDDSLPKQNGKFCIGGYLSKLYLIEASVVELDSTMAIGLDGAKEVVKTAPKTGGGTPGRPATPPPDFGTPKNGSAIEAKVTADKTLPLPGKIGEACSGGGGRYILMTLPGERKLVVFDASEGKIVKYLSLAEADAKIAGGLDYFAVVLPEAKLALRYNYSKFERESTVAVEIKGQLLQAVMGSASRGPLVLQASGGPTFLDPDKMKALDYEADKRGMGGLVGHPQYVPEVRISANGKIMTSWSKGVSPSGISIHTFEGKEIKTVYEHESGGALMPNADGTAILATGQIFNADAKPVGKKVGGFGSMTWYVPATSGNYYLALNETGKNNNPRGPKDISVDIRLLDREGTLVTLPKVAGLEDLFDIIPNRALPLDRHVFFSPDAKLLVVIPASKDKLYLTRLDVDEALEKSGVDYLNVTSKPPAQFLPGETLTYAIAVKIKKGPAKFKLESGPDGMKVSPEGKLEWQVPADFSEQEPSVILSITDTGGQEIFHTFRMKKK